MQLPDVNVLIYAHREDAPEHERYAAWLRALTESDEPFAVSEVVLAGVIRIVTNPKIFDPPSPTGVAVAFCLFLKCVPAAHPSIDWRRVRSCVLHWRLSRPVAWSARDHQARDLVLMQ